MTLVAKDCADAGRVVGLEVKDGFYPIECCPSCHEDANEGYDELIEVERGEDIYLVCCAMLRRLDGLDTP